MAYRRPLVVVNGDVRELPNGDVLTGDPLTWEPPLPSGSWGLATANPFGTNVSVTGATVTQHDTTALVDATGAPGYLGTHNAVDMSVAAATYRQIGPSSFWCNSFRQRGFVFSATVGLSSVASTCGYIGMLNRGGAVGGGSAGSGLYGGTSASDWFFGIGRDEGDASDVVYLITSNGSTRSKTLLTRTGAGYSASSGATFSVHISCAPAATAATLNVTDRSNDYPCLVNHVVDMTAYPTSASFAATAACATGGTAAAATVRFYEFGFFPYPGSQVYAQSASNILGNAATATALAAQRTIQGVPFDGSANINVVSVGTTAPADPVLNQLWIQT